MSLYYKLTDGDRILSDPPKKVTLVNLLPMPVTVVLLQGLDSDVVDQEIRYKPISELAAFQTREIEYPGSDYGTKISCVKGRPSSANPYLTMPIQFGYASKYFFGAYSWNTFDTDTNFYNLYSDLPGLRVKNHFPFPVHVVYKNMSFDIPKRFWNSSLVGGSPSTIYFDNQGNGIDVGDTFMVFGVDDRRVKLGEFKIPNRFVRNIHIGTTSTNK